MTSRDLFELEHGDTGVALLPAPEKVNAGPAYNTAPEQECRYALAWLCGYDPELYERAMRRGRGDYS